MDQNILFEIKKFPALPVFFTDRNKVKDFEKTIKNLPKNSAIIIREYDLDEKNREIFAKKIASLARSQGLKILVGKDFALAKKIKADGIHFSDFDKLPLLFLKKKSFPKNFIFSFSCHNLKSILKIKKFSPDIIFISPIFPTSSHAGSKSLGLKNLAKITLKTKNPDYFLYALGGINLQNLKAVRKLKISGFGAISLFSKI
jgi:thiamine-phosphate pyrophosphorylase